MQRQIQEATMVYKSVNSLTPDYLRSMFADRNTVTGYQLRDTEGKLAIFLPRTNFLKNSFSYSGAVLWNSLLLELRHAQTLNSFRTGCRRVFTYRYIQFRLDTRHSCKADILFLFIYFLYL